MVGRTRFMGDVLYSIGVSGFIYPIFGHWVLGSGWLPRHDGQRRPLPAEPRHELPRLRRFDRGALDRRLGRDRRRHLLGPRLGRKFKRDGGGPMLPHDLTIAVIGGLILWFGWYGFNPCSTLSIMDIAGVGRVAMNTTLAACTGGLAAVFLMYFAHEEVGRACIINGFLAGLVAITCPCYWVSDVGACVIGAVAGVLVIAGDGAARVSPHRRSRRRLAGPRRVRHLGHAVAGLVRQRRVPGGRFEPVRGCPSIAPDSPEALTGLFYGGGTKVLMAQCVGSVIICAAHVRQRDGDVQGAQCVQAAPRLQGGRTQGPGHRPARHLGLPRVCHFVDSWRLLQPWRRLIRASLAIHAVR